MVAAHRLLPRDGSLHHLQYRRRTRSSDLMRSADSEYPVNARRADEPPVWLVAGAAHGVGRILAAWALRYGNRLAATSDRLEDLLPIVDRDESAVIPIELDVNDESVSPDRATSHRDPGSARCGGERCGLRHGGCRQRRTELERAQANLFGALWISRAALVYMRVNTGSRIIRVFGLESLENYIADAKAICYACQARKECLEFALATRHGFGIWGGRDEDER